MELTSSNLGQVLKSQRELANLTQADVAERAGLSRSRVAAIERGASANIELKSLERLLMLYGLRLAVEPRTPRRTLNAILRDNATLRDEAEG